MIKLHLISKENELAHIWFVHEPKALKWSETHVENHFKSKVKATYDKEMKLLSVVDDETGTELWRCEK